MSNLKDGHFRHDLSYLTGKYPIILLTVPRTIMRAFPGDYAISFDGREPSTVVAGSSHHSLPSQFLFNVFPFFSSE